MPITLDGTLGITTPSYGGADAAEYLVPVTAFKNRIINGAMVLDQRNNGASVTASSAYTLDRWICYSSAASKYTVQQNAGSVTPPAGFRNYLGATSTSAYSVGSTDFFSIEQPIEGFNAADLAWGTASAQSVTLSFWVRSSLTGTFGGAFYAATGTLGYAFSYTISAANTWEQKSVVITGPTTGTWASNNSAFGSVCFSLGMGSSYSWATGSWLSQVVRSATGATSVVGTNGATFYLTGVQLEVGTNATFFDARPYTTELQLCQRYYYRISGGGNARHAIAGNGAVSGGFPTTFSKVSMRSSSVTFSFSSLSHFTLEGLTGGGTAVPTSITLNAANTEAFTLYTQSSGSGTGTAVQLLGSTAAAWTAYDAEL